MRLELSPDEFWSLTPAELALVARRQNERIKRPWRIARWIGAIIVNVFRGKGRPAITPEKLLKLDDDDEKPREANYMSKERFDYLVARWSKIKPKNARKRR